MKFLDVSIVKSIEDVLENHLQLLRVDLDKFEEILIDHTVNKQDEVYLFMQMFQLKIIDSVIVDIDYSKEKYLPIFMEKYKLSYEESLFVLYLIEHLKDKLGFITMFYQFDERLTLAYEKTNLRELKLFARCFKEGFGIHQDYVKAYELYRYIYTKGDHSVVYDLGWMFENGYGVERDVDKALEYYLEGTDDQSAFKSGYYYMSVSEEKALNYFKASEDPRAKLYEGHIYLKHRQYNDAIHCYSNGSKHLNPSCCFELGNMYKIGLGVQRNPYQAVELYYHGYLLGDGDCAVEIAKMIIDHFIEGTEQQILALLETGVYLGSVQACLMLGTMYEMGHMVDQSRPRSLFFYNKANELDDLKGKYYEEI